MVETWFAGRCTCGDQTLPVPSALVADDWCDEHLDMMAHLDPAGDHAATVVTADSRAEMEVELGVRP